MCDDKPSLIEDVDESLQTVSLEHVETGRRQNVEMGGRFGDLFGTLANEASKLVAADERSSPAIMVLWHGSQSWEWEQ